jgi:hypothetical protein
MIKDAVVAPEAIAGNIVVEPLLNRDLERK